MEGLIGAPGISHAGMQQQEMRHHSMTQRLVQLPQMDNKGMQTQVMQHPSVTQKLVHWMSNKGMQQLLVLQHSTTQGCSPMQLRLQRCGEVLPKHQRLRPCPM